MHDSDSVYYTTQHFILNKVLNISLFRWMPCFRFCKYLNSGKNIDELDRMPAFVSIIIKYMLEKWGNVVHSS